MIRVRLVVALMLLMFAGTPALAHLTPNSEIALAFGRTKVVADIVVPVGELGYATGIGIGPLDRRSKAMLSAYFLRAITVRAPDGRRWQAKITQLGISADASSPDIELAIRLTPPVGAPLRRFDLDYRAVIDRVPNHFVLIAVRSDSDSGRLSDRPQMLGALQQGHMTIRIDRGDGSAWRGFASAIRLGMHHIAEGHDHLLFLIALLLPAPLLVRDGRWAGYGGFAFTARRLLAVVTAFTIGHSLTLIGGAAFGWQLPAQPVEVAIAVSILISALHAWRPIFAGREALIAGSFGLVHGLAFATLIARFGLEPMQKAQSILGFNIGIELVQIAMLLVVAPLLVAMARTSSYAAFRIGAAGFAGIAALAWIAERLFGVDNVAGRLIDAGLGHATWLLAALVALAGFMVWSDKRRHRRPTYR